MLLKRFILVIPLTILVEGRPFLNNFLPALGATTPATPESAHDSVVSDYHNQPHTHTPSPPGAGVGGVLAGLLAGGASDGKAGGSSIFPEFFGNFLNIAREYLASTVAGLISGAGAAQGTEEPRKMPSSTMATTSTESSTEKSDEDGEELPKAEALVGARSMDSIQKIEARLLHTDADSNAVESTPGRKLNSDTIEILDAFFDLDSDDIFYNGTGSKSIQHPRVLALIRSSMAKYRSQAEMGLLRDLTPQERNRIRVLYMIRPIFGVLRRKSENSKIREKLRTMELMLDEIQEASIPRRARRLIPLPRRRRSVEDNLVDDRDLKSDLDAYEKDLKSDLDAYEKEMDKEADDVLNGKAELDFDDVYGLLFIMELFGTVAGLAFGAFTQVSDYLAS